MYDPIRGKIGKKDRDYNQNEKVPGTLVDDSNETDDEENNNETEEEKNEADRSKQETSNDPWIDEEDRVANFYITTNPKYNRTRLPRIIKIRNPQEGEVPIFEKRSYPKAARIHKKREDTDPHR